MVLDRGIVEWVQVKDISNLFRLPDLGPDFFPCPFVPGSGSRAHGNPDVAAGEVVVGTLAG